MIKYRDEMKNVNAYIPGKPIETVQRELNIDKVIKMASNENPFGTSEKVKKVLKTMESHFIRMEVHFI